MVPERTNPATGERLSELLEVERHLERRLEEARSEAEARLSQARARAAELDGDGNEKMDRDEHEHDRLALERHQAELDEIASESRQQLARIESISDELLDDWAERASSRVIRGH